MTDSHDPSRQPAARPLRVCIVGPSLDILGGQAVQAQRLMEHFARVPGLEVEFLPVNPRLPGLLGRLQKIKYVRTVLTETAYLISLLRRLPACDIAHVFSASNSSFVLAPTPAILLARAFGKKVVLNYRSGEAQDHLRRWRTAVPTVRLAQRVAVPSGYLVDVFGRFGVPATSIFNIVDLERFRFRRREPLRPVFLANRNLEPMYNVGCVLRAFARVQREIPAARLVVAGDGSQRAALEALAGELGLRGVEFVGRVTNARMVELIDAADVYLNASDIDNMPGSIIEAFAAGLPVVTTDAGGIPYIVRDRENGMLVSRGDDAALAARSLELLRDPALGARLIARAHDECRTLYHWEAVRQQWLALYASLAPSGASTVSSQPASHAVIASLPS